MLILTVSRLYWNGKIYVFFFYFVAKVGEMKKKKKKISYLSIRPQTSHYFTLWWCTTERKDDTSKGFKASYQQLTAALKPSYCLLFSLLADLHVWVSLYSSFFWHNGQLHHQQLLMKKVTETPIVRLYLYQT